MTTLRVKQIKKRLLDLFKQHLDLRDISISDKERENKILTRCLAAFAIYTQTGCSEKDAAISIWDGSGDNGIDAVYYDKSSSKVIIVQSKWIHSGSGEPEAKDISTFANGVKDLVELETANFSERLHSKIFAISEAINTPGTTLDLIIITTGSSKIARPGMAALERIASELNGSDQQEPLATTQIIGLPDVYPAIASGSSHDKISIDANIIDWSFVSQPYAAYFGIVDGLQLKTWWSSFGKRLVAKNIRHSLGHTDVNNQIMKTAISNPENFWYFNNGITLIADEALKAPVAAASRSSGVFQFNGASIVNGAQTVSTLARVENDENLGLVRVPIRVILLKGAPEGFGGEVTRTNNLQNRVEGRDFVAQDPEQRRLQMEMAIESIEYQYLRSEDFISSPRSCELIELTTALACASGDASHAVAVKTGIGRFYNDLTKAPYKALFNAKLSGARAFNTITIQRKIDQWIDNKQSMAGKKSGFSWGVLIHGNRILASSVFKLIDVNIMSQSISDFDKSVQILNIEKKCDDIYKGMVSVLDKDYQGKFLAVLFKSTSMSKDVLEKSIQFYKDKTDK
ncbi:AIPR family protein [Xanthobacter sp. DSM 24535]|uniref:AIPR family protein n=1 Tax=Roseixanthobacter psychrophilus TaxID=3119917 RepID=UPI003727D836